MKRLTIFFSFLSFLFFCSFAHSALQFDENVSPKLKRQILSDLEFIQSIRATSSSPLHQKVFGEVSGKNYLDWFDARIFSVGIDDCTNPNAVACVYEPIPNKMWMTKNYTKFNHPAIARISIVYHEARHTERGNHSWRHAPCPTPFLDEKGAPMMSIWTGTALAGQNACDVTPFGSYGISAIFLKNIFRFCENCSDKVKADADLFGTDQSARIVDLAAKKSMTADFSSASSKPKK